MQDLSGILVLDKPRGITSAAAVARVKRTLPRGTKIGHAGSLDPFATGVLLLLVGRATKQCEMLMGQSKQYEATVKLGATTQTDDPESPEMPTVNIAPAQRDMVESALRQFTGSIQQRPPAYSALKIGGRRACDRVRDGQTVVMEPRTVQVYRIDLVEYYWPLARLRIDCGRGTYVRAIARDLGETLGVGGYLTELHRTRIGDFDITKAVTLEQLSRDNLSRLLIPL
jgi:tRNA pseudouridine55 synthase